GQSPHADHGVHPPEVSHEEPLPKIDPPFHAEAGQASDDDGGRCLPDKAAPDRLKGPQAVFTQVAASDRRQSYGCSHRDPTNPDDSSQDMESARPMTTSVTVALAVEMAACQLAQTRQACVP